jgi:putative ATP-dependent endonuclease of OLD family
MKIESVEIERFLGIKHAYFELHPSLQVFAGANNAGKTTLLRAINLFFSVEENCASELFQPRNDYYEQEGSRALTRIKISFSVESDEEQRSFAEALNKGKTFWCECRISRLGKVSFRVSKTAAAHAVHGKLCDLYQLVFIPAARVGIMSPSDGSQRLIAACRDMLVRTRPGKKSSLQRKFENDLERVSLTIKELLTTSAGVLKELLPEAMSLDFLMPGPETTLDRLLEKVEVSMRPGLQVSLKEEGTGFQSILSLGFLAYAARKLKPGNQLLFLVEEPEAFLHPQYQREVALFLSKLGKSSQLLLTTHSSIIVDSIDIRQVARVRRESDVLEWEWKRPTLSDTEASKHKRWCDAKNSELVFADKLILCEGPGDKWAIEALIKRVDEKLRRSTKVTVLGMETADNASAFLELAALFELPTLLVTDKDSCGPKGRLSKMCRSVDRQLELEELRIISSLAQQACVSFKIAMQVRDEINSITRSRGIFILSSDLEGALASSLNRGALGSIFGPKGVDRLSSDDLRDLEGKVGANFERTLMSMLGSKGWDVSGKVDRNKPKPHFVAAVIERHPKAFRKFSDFRTLEEEIYQFIES